MDKEAFTKLLEQPESDSLEWKRDFPTGLRQGKKGPDWEKARGTLLKDLASLANADTAGMAHLVYGVKDHRTRREVVGLKKTWDDATFQQWVENNFHPPIRFAYSELKYDGKAIGIFQISRSGLYPHVVCQNIGGVIHEGQVWFRRGSKNTVALYNDLRGMFRGNEPVKIAKLNSPTLKHIQRHYEDQGRRTTLPLLAEKDDFLGQGYEIAYAPDTRREVWAGYNGHKYEHILMLKPVSR